MVLNSSPLGIMRGVSMVYSGSACIPLMSSMLPDSTAVDDMLRVPNCTMASWNAPMSAPLPNVAVILLPNTCYPK